jgi:hypothetical protein
MMRNVLLVCFLLAMAFSACSQKDAAQGGQGASTGSGGKSDATGGAAASGGATGSGGVVATGGVVANGGATSARGGNSADGGGLVGGSAVAGTRGSANGGAAGRTTASPVGGATGDTGGKNATGGAGGKNATGGAGGKSATGGSTTSVRDAGGGVDGHKTTAVKDLPTIKAMPDPLTMNDGTKVTTVQQWQLRRQEMIQILEDYEYGHMPPPPGNVKATTTTALKRITSGKLQADYRMLHLTFGPGEKLGFDLSLFAPVTDGGASYPILIYLSYNAGESSLADASAALARGYAVATIGYAQLGADSSSWASSAFFPAYPDYDWRDISAWAWGMSRAVDYLVTDPAFAPDKIMITGVSRLAQAVLVAGAFDERIALSAPVAGGMAFRYSGKEMGGGLGQGITEVVDQVTYWFGPRFPEFKNQTPKLPCDQHWLPALTAPRLFIMCNSFADEYGRAYAAVQTYVYAKPVYELLGAEQSLGLNFREGGHGITSEDWSAILDFADQYLLKKGGTRKFDVLPPASKTP